MANEKQTWRTYSLLDVHVVFSHPDVGTYTITDEGAGRISFAYGDDLGSVTPTANGYVVVNRLRNRHGTVQLEIPQASLADEHLRKWIKYIKRDDIKTERFALGTMTITDDNLGITYNLSGVVPQKDPDETFDKTAGFRTYNMLFADYTMQ